MKIKENQSRIIKILQAISTVVFALILMFAPAGTWRWLEAWIFILFYSVVVTVAIIWMKKRAPDLLKERQTKKKDAKTWDKIFMRTYSLMLVFLIIIPGWDAVRYGWSHVPLALKVAAFVGAISLCTTGPYRYVRHPMYVGVILIMLCFPISLGSYFGLIPADPGNLVMA